MTNLDLSRIIQEKIKSKSIACSRYYYSTLTGYSKPLKRDMESLLQSVSVSHEDFYQPDLTILLHVNSQVQKKRLQKRNNGVNFGSDERCLNDKEYNKNISLQYLDAAKRNSWLIIDTSDMTIDEVVKKCIYHIESLEGK